MVPGLKFSATTSALAASLRATSAPAGLCRSIAMLFLLRLNIGKKPAPAPSRWRVRSPSIGSTLMTSAPMSASTMPQVGPMTMWVNSTTRRPASGRRRDAGSGEVAGEESGAFMRVCPEVQAVAAALSVRGGPANTIVPSGRHRSRRRAVAGGSSGGPRLAPKPGLSTAMCGPLSMEWSLPAIVPIAVVGLSQALTPPPAPAARSPCSRSGCGSCRAPSSRWRRRPRRRRAWPAS